MVKAYHREAVVIAQFDATNRELRQAATRAQIFAGFIGPLMNVINNLGLAIVAGVGGWMAVQGMATVGTIASFISYTRQFGRPLNEIANLYNLIQAAVAGAERVFEVIDEPAEVDASQVVAGEHDAADALPGIRGDVVFEDVSFAYEPGVPVLQNVSLHAGAGPDGGAGRADRRGQDDDRQPADALLRDRAGSRHDRRPGSAGHREGRPAPPARHRAAGHLSVRRHGDGQHPLWAAAMPATTR